ncbi:wdr5 [Symbiodinium sp. CCMP2592]|nr:wdr5 [Symbiodinium sp. CCMP2592]
MAGKASSCLAACPELQLPASTVAYLDSVLSELTAEETEDYAVLHALLEPFLLDALKQNGRETPHNSTSDAKVERMCRLLYNQLRKATTNNSRRQLGEIPQISAALRKAAASVSDRLQLSTDLVDSLAISLAAMTWAEISVDGKPCDHTMAEILEPSLQEAFHDCGDWPASEDTERARLMAAALLKQLLDD